MRQSMDSQFLTFYIYHKTGKKVGAMGRGRSDFCLLATGVNSYFLRIRAELLARSFRRATHLVRRKNPLSSGRLII